MRLLMSYRAAKFKQQSKIKSKQYHRIKKRQKRRQLIKEIEELMARDPEAAKEKLKELEVDRAYERATLKHRGTNKWSKQIRQFATRNPELRKLMQEHLKFGRELKGKHGVKGSDESSSDEAESDESDAEDKPLTVGEIVELAAEQAFRESKEVAIQSASQDPELKKSLKALRNERKKILKASKLDAAGSTATEWTVEDDDAALDIVATQKSLEELASEAIRAETEKASKASQNEEGGNRKVKSKKKLKKAKSKSTDPSSTELSTTVEEAAETAELKHRLNKLKRQLDAEEAPSEKPAQDGKKSKKRVVGNKKKKSAREEANAEKQEEPVKDISIDPQYFLSFEEDRSRQIPTELLDQMEDFEGNNQDDLMAEAFEDDDVLGEFEAEKEEVAAGERPQDIDLTLHGWGSWTGPGITARKNRTNRFVLKQDAQKRKDDGRKRVIIRETAATSKTLAALQPRDVPFPFTSVKDYETVIRQPIGKDWNSQLAFMKLTQPSVVTKAGRIIRPLDKDEVMRQRRLQEEDDLDDEPIV